MFTFNDDNIFVGYIKQLLHTFNLPKAKVYQKDTYLYDNGLYLTDNMLYQYYNGELTPIRDYTYNKKILNYTTNLKINTNIYDTHTHEYLGEYLRFLRDYKHLDLMPLYNCFSNNLCTELHLKSKDETIQIDSSDAEYKIYAIPVKYFKKYSIAISSDSSVSVCCGFYNGITNYTPATGDANDPTPLGVDIISETFVTYANMDFNNIQVYDKLVNIVNAAESTIDKNLLLQNEDNLKLFIRLPITNNSSIVILEGDFKENNNLIWKTDDPYVKSTNYLVLNTENKITEDFTLPSPSQLLQLNTNISYVFADRLMEYLTNNAITGMDDISDNIKRLQAKIKELTTGAGISTNLPMKSGIWDNSYKYYLYSKGMSSGWFKNSFDILGYVDKDMEQSLGKEPDIYKGE